MFSVQEATEIVRKAIPNGKIQWQTDYQDLYLFQVFTDDPFEEEMDPFYSVNKETGEFRDFSILTDGNAEIAALFMKAHQSNKEANG
jgi:hypothetical protein